MSIPLLLETTKAIEGRIKEANIPLVSPRELNRWIVFHTFGVVTYVVSLRGPEGFLIDLKGLHDSWDEENGNFFIIALRGKIKGEHNARCHHLPCVHITVTGLRIRESVARLMSWKAKRGFMDGPAISDLKGDLLSSRFIDDSLLEVLEDLFESNQAWFPSKFETALDLRKSYQVFRTLRRTSDTRALEMKVSKTDIDLVNRWAVVEKAQGRRPGLEMRQYYADITLILEPFLRYTKAM